MGRLVHFPTPVDDTSKSGDWLVSDVSLDQDAKRPDPSRWGFPRAFFLVRAQPVADDTEQSRVC